MRLRKAGRCYDPRVVEMCDVAVVGAGAAGLAAAIFAAETAAARGMPLRVVMLDGAAKIGTKILISGGGRCNVTHDVVQASDFHGTQHVIRHVLAQFGVDDTLAWFESHGVRLKREPTGKLFPVHDSARTVLDALLNRCRQLGVQLRTGHRVDALQTLEEADAEPGAPLFGVHHQRGALRARRVIMATGGRSLPRTGSDGGGQELLRRLGHSVTVCVPALVPLVLDAGMFHAHVSGVSCEVELTASVEGKLIERRRGSLLWTHFGISGPVVLDISRVLTAAWAAGRMPSLRCNLFPGWSRDELDAWLLRRVAEQPRLLLRTLIGEAIPARLAEQVIAFAHVEGDAALGALRRDARRRLVSALIELELPVTRDRGWNYAEVTAGGIPLSEINFRTMESRQVAGLYLAGELLDCDGRIGGFNFQWAWATGHAAGRAVAASLG